MELNCVLMGKKPSRLKLTHLHGEVRSWDWRKDQGFGTSAADLSN